LRRTLGRGGFLLRLLVLRARAGLWVIAGALVWPMLAAAAPPVWMAPPGDQGRALRELFDHPDEWAATRLRIQGLGYADHNLARQFSDAEMRPMFAQLKSWGLKFGLEVGAVKRWAPTGARAFAIDRKSWDRFIGDGAEIAAVAMDEPLSFSVKEMGEPIAYAVAQTADFISLVRAAYPGMLVGDIEPYPSLSAADLLAFIDALQAALRQRRVRGLDFLRLDVDWMFFENGSAAGAQGWLGVRRLEALCHQRGLPFSLIYWAADYPSLLRLGLATDATWEDGIMRQGAAYARVGGVPDQVMIQSWVHAPEHAVPETASGTFTRSVLDFTNAFVTR
jgi:hypothetical protein